MASVAPVRTFPDDPESWLDYLARTTRWTVGARCAAAQLVAVGEFDGPDDSVMPSELIEGAVDGSSFTLVLPKPAGAGAVSRHPLPQDGDQLLVFLSKASDHGWRPIDAPAAIVLRTAADDFEEQVDAARWFCSLSGDSGRRTAELASAIADGRSAVRFSAVRAVADEGLESVVPTLQEAATDETTEPRTATYAAVSLWLLGERDSATEAFEAIARRVGSEQFHTLWQVQRSLGDDSATLYGPDPDAWRAS